MISRLAVLLVVGFLGPLLWWTLPSSGPWPAIAGPDERVQVSAADVYRTQLTRDALGRITKKIETIQGATTTFDYEYDLRGRLAKVKQDSVVTATYTYDDNGNRLSGPGLGTPPTYDAQDRLTQYGGTSFTYNRHGDLSARTDGGGTTTYTYDEFGNLTRVELPGGTTVDYVIDALNRRIGKKVNGTLVRRWLYDGQLRIVAELDGVGTLLSRFVYATRVNVPDYMVRGAVTYRIVTDYLGSPRLVIDAATGAIVQQMTHDEFGRVTLDTNPGSIPFGYAGGLHDPDTGLIRFGARDYDAESGRWTAKDPTRFETGVNLFAYVSSEPINHVDFDGRELVNVSIWGGADLYWRGSLDLNDEAAVEWLFLVLVALGKQPQSPYGLTVQAGGIDYCFKDALRKLQRRLELLRQPGIGAHVANARGSFADYLDYYVLSGAGKRFFDIQGGRAGPSDFRIATRDVFVAGLQTYVPLRAAAGGIAKALTGGKAASSNALPGMLPARVP